MSQPDPTPSADLVPGVTSRIVYVDTTDLTEGYPMGPEHWFNFALTSSLDTSDGVIIAETSRKLHLIDGKTEIRLPTYDSDADTPDGTGDWEILVTSSFGYCKKVRVPVGTSRISLASLANVEPLTGLELQYAITQASVTIVEGSGWDASINLSGGILHLTITVPPGGTAWYKGALGSGADLDTLADGAYVVVSGDVAEAIGLPENLNGVVESYDWVGLQRYHVKTTGEQRTWQRSRFSSGWAAWERVDGNSWFRGNLDEQEATTLAGLRPGLYLVRYVGTAEAFDLPQRLIGQLEVIDANSQRQIYWRPNDAGAGWGTKIEWVLSTDSGGELRDRWQRIDKAIMRTAPVVLTSPAGDYPQADSRGAVRLPFTVPTTIGKVRVHMRPWNFRTREEWGPARLSGVMIAQQNGEDSGTITGSRWYAPGVDGQIVTGSEEWVSDWFYVGLTEGNTYLLSYAAEWQDTSRNLVSGQCWSNFDLAKWDTTEDAIYQNGWGGFTLNPMDVWIECEAPSDVPVWGYFESSNGVFAGARSVFGAYPAVHARKNGAFAAVTAAGGWSPMDETFHDAAIIERFGYPARMLDRMYLGMGANIEARDASAAEAIVELDRWMTVRTPGLGNPPIYLLTQISRYTSEETEDTAGTLSEWNEWIRYEATQRNDVVGLIDQAAIFQDPEKPWTARVELRNSPTDVHFGPMGQKLRAQALDGEIHLPTMTARNSMELAYERGELPWQDITGLLNSRPTGGKLFIRRTPGYVEYSVAGISTLTNGVILEWGTLPEEYRPDLGADFPVIGENGSEVLITPNYGGGISFTRGFAGVPYWGTGRLPTKRPAPIVHPGVVAGFGEQPGLALSPADAAQMIGRVRDFATEYDSGMRNIQSLLENPGDWTVPGESAPSAILTLQRIGPRVTLTMSGVRYFGTGTGAIRMMLLPTGFQPPEWVYPANTLSGKGTQVRSNGLVYLYGPSSTNEYVTLQWVTRQPPPTTLPGSPA